jgi:putative membrane-bound dehydrogenase-like protein
MKAIARMSVTLAGVLGVFCLKAKAEEKDPLEFPPPKSAKESLACIQTKPGLRVELVASEPLVVDPVAIDWGPDGKLWVVEMRDYPTGMDGNWKPGSRIKLLEDTNGDGIYDKATIFLDNLPFATGVTAWGKGALVCTAPDILYAEATKGHGPADRVEKLFTGFATGNYQARVNSLSLGLDNWVYGANGLLGGIIRGESRGLAQSPRSKAQSLKSSASAPLEVDIRGRDFRMNPETGAFEPASGLTQQGRARDDWGDWFGCDNSVAAWHYPIPDHYLWRNPHVPAPSPRVAIAAGVNGNLLYPVSHPLERFNNPGALNRVTSGCGIGVYRDALFGDDFYGNTFLCEPVHNLVHRMVMKPNGLTFNAVRAPEEQHSEFLASTDNWFRPVQMRMGPDGAIWVVDMYRFVIEHPRWIPPERLEKLDVRAGDDKGRIYRVYPAGAKLRKTPDLTRIPGPDLAAMLDTATGTERDRIHQELVFGMHAAKGSEPDRKTVQILDQLAAQSSNAAICVQALCVLDGLNSLKADFVARALGDPRPFVRANAVRLTERFAQAPQPESKATASSSSSLLLEKLISLADDPDLHVRYQLALTLGEWDDPRVGACLGKIAARDLGDEWMRAAVLSSATRQPEMVLQGVLGSGSEKPERDQMVAQLIATAAGERNADSLGKILAITSPADSQHLKAWQLTALNSLLDALERKKLRLEAVAGENLARVNLLFDWAGKIVLDSNAKETSREAAARLLGRQGERENQDLEMLAGLLDPATPGGLQKAALDSLKRNHNPQVAKLLLSRWSRLPFSLRSGVIEALLSRDDWTKQLLAALENGGVGRNELSLANRQALLKSGNKQVVEATHRVWPVNPLNNRSEVIAKYQSALSLPGNPFKGRAVWAKNCVICHYFRGQGNNVGPNLGALTDKTPADFLTAILDPNAAVEPRFVAYNIQTKDDRSLTGVVSAESATTLTLVQAGGTHETILRSDIAEIHASGVSLMPEGLEQNMSPQDLADLISYLNSAPHPLGSATPEQAAAAKKNFLATGSQGIARIVAEGEHGPHESWMGELPLAACLQAEGQNRLAWETPPVATDLKPGESNEFRLAVSMGYGGGPPGRFILKLNNHHVLEFDVALHDQAWHSTDGKVEMTYMAMQDSPDESNGLIDLTVSDSLLEAGKGATFEVIGPAAKSRRWFGAYVLAGSSTSAAR